MKENINFENNYNKSNSGSEEDQFEKKESKLEDDARERAERVSALIRLVEEYYLSMMDELEDLRQDMAEKKVDFSQEDFKELFSFDFDKLKNLVDYTVPALLEKINLAVKNKDTEIIEHNSVVDIMTNSMLACVSSIRDVIRQIRAEKATEIRNSKKQLIKVLAVSLDAAIYYSSELCQDDKKLNQEVASLNGYIEKFADYFKKIDVSGLAMIPQGGKKLPLFRFFSELEKGKMSQSEATAELEKLDATYLDKEKLGVDIANGLFEKMDL